MTPRQVKGRRVRVIPAILGLSMLLGAGYLQLAANAAPPEPVHLPAPSAEASQSPSEPESSPDVVALRRSHQPPQQAGVDPISLAMPDRRLPSAPNEVAAPVAVQIPAIDVSADLVELGLEPDGAMEVPDFGLAGWYVNGPKPGEPGPAVIAAHVDSSEGPDVFYRLGELRPDDRIIVELQDGTHVEFTAASAELSPKDQLPVDRIWDAGDEPALRLITCAGEFDHTARSYLSNLIVYAEHARR